MSIFFVLLSKEQDMTWMYAAICKGRPHATGEYLVSQGKGKKRTRVKWKFEGPDAWYLLKNIPVSWQFTENEVKPFFHELEQALQAEAESVALDKEYIRYPNPSEDEKKKLLEWNTRYEKNRDLLNITRKATTFIDTPISIDGIEIYYFDADVMDLVNRASVDGWEITGALGDMVGPKHRMMRRKI